MFVSIGVTAAIMLAAFGFLAYQMTWWYWHPNALLVVMRGKDRRRHVFKIIPNDGKFKWRNRTYVVTPELCDPFGRFNSMCGEWIEGIANQIDKVNLKLDSAVAAQKLSDAEIDRENRLVQRAINPFAGGYVSPMIQILITAGIMIVGIAAILMTVLPKFGEIQTDLRTISQFIGVPDPNAEVTE